MVGYPLAILLSLLLNGACGYPWSVVTSIQQLDNNRSPSIQQSSSKNEERLSELKLQNEMKWEQKRFKESSKESIWMSLDSESDQAEGDGSSSSEHSRNVEQVGDEMSDDTPLQNSKIKAYNNITYNLKKFIKQAMLRQNYEKSHKQQKKQMRFRNRPRGLAGRRRGGSRTTGEYTLSIVNPLEVLRRRLELEMARRRMKENRKQIKANEAILRNLG